MQVGALGNAMAQARGAYQQRAADELHEDAVARLRELEDRLRPSQDQVERQIVRAPVDGTVMALRVSAPRHRRRAARAAARNRAIATSS